MPKAKAPNNGLTGQQEAFIRYYLQIGVGKKAALLAGYSEKTAETQASQMLKHPKIAAAIAKANSKAISKAQEKLNVTQESLLRDAEFIKNRTMYGESVYDEEGNLVEIVGQDDRIAIQALSTMAKLMNIGGFAPANSTTNIQVNNNSTTISNASYDLTKLTEKERQALALLLQKAMVSEAEAEELKALPKKRDS
jgi:phage terminase small subunit